MVGYSFLILSGMVFQTPDGNSWLGSLIATIIGNLKISISNVHIRYEDVVRYESSAVLYIYNISYLKIFCQIIIFKPLLVILVVLSVLE